MKACRRCLAPVPDDVLKSLGKGLCRDCDNRRQVGERRLSGLLEHGACYVPACYRPGAHQGYCWAHYREVLRTVRDWPRMRRREERASRDARMAAEYREGLSLVAIAARHGMSKAGARQGLLRAGVEMRPRGRPRTPPVSAPAPPSGTWAGFGPGTLCGTNRE